MAQVDMVKPDLGGDFIHENQSGNAGNPHSNNNITTSFIACLYVHKPMECQYYCQQAVAGVKLYPFKIKGIDSDGHHYNQFDDIECEKKFTNPWINKWSGILDRGSLNKGNGKHTENPAGKFPCKGESIQKSMAYYTTKEGGKAH